MFSSEQRLKERTGRHGTPRLEYLQALVTEFSNTGDEEANEQIVANLANFAYDPINYEHLRRLNVVDLFLDCLTEQNERLKEFALGGLCNCCPDPKMAEIIVKYDNIDLIIGCLSSPVENTVLSAISTLFYLCNHSTQKEILTPAVLQAMQQYAAPESANVCIRNLARCFLDKHVGGGTKR